jgi:hypothetical protein
VHVNGAMQASCGVYVSAPSSGSSSPGAAGASAAASSSAGASTGAVYISRLEVAAGDTIGNGEQLAELDGQPLFVLRGTVPAWRDLVPGESGPDVAELQNALASLGYYDGGDTAGYFGAATEDAVALYYEHLGYTAPSSGGVPASAPVWCGPARSAPAAEPPGRLFCCVRRSGARLIGEAGVPGLHFHDLRRVGGGWPRLRERALRS